LSRAQDVRKQLITLMDRHQMDVVSCGKNYVRIRQCVVAGFFSHAARKDQQDVGSLLIIIIIINMH
jgi:ATP-dependent RNA helicase DHX8/PRP22